jgi:hypothetical protein
MAFGYQNTNPPPSDEQCPRENTFIRGNVSARARLATPRDLGCIPTGATQ